MQDDQLRQSLRDTLTSKGITDEKEIAIRIDSMLNPEPDLSKHMTKENRVYLGKRGMVKNKR